MKNKTISITFAILAIFLVCLSGYLLMRWAYGVNAPSPNLKSSSMQTNRVRITDSPDWPFAHLISVVNLDRGAQQALSGFQLQRNTMPDGSLNITLKALSSEYVDQDYVVVPGESLYFIDRSSGDDAAPDGERSLADDHAVLVDADGYILSSS